MSYVEVGDHVVWNGEKFIVESLQGSGGLIVKSTERDFKTCVSKLSVTPVSKPKKPRPSGTCYETFHNEFTRKDVSSSEDLTFTVGERVELRSKSWHTSFMSSFGILEGHVGKIVQIKRLESSTTVVWKIYVENPLWHYKLPDKDDAIMEFYTFEIHKLSNK